MKLELDFYLTWRDQNFGKLWLEFNGFFKYFDFTIEKIEKHFIIHICCLPRFQIAKLKCHQKIYSFMYFNIHYYYRLQTWFQLIQISIHSVLALLRSPLDVVFTKLSSLLTRFLSKTLAKLCWVVQKEMLRSSACLWWFNIIVINSGGWTT